MITEETLEKLIISFIDKFDIQKKVGFRYTIIKLFRENEDKDMNKIILEQLIEDNKKYINTRVYEEAFIPATNVDLTKDNNNLSLSVPDIIRKQAPSEGNVLVDVYKNISVTNTTTKPGTPPAVNTTPITEVTPTKSNVNINNIAIPTLDGFTPDKSSADMLVGGLNTGINVIDNTVNNTVSSLNTVGTTIKTAVTNFNNNDAPQSTVDNYALIEQKSDTRKTVDLSVQNATPYYIDNTLKQFNGGGVLNVNSIVSGAIGILNTVSELSNSFFDMDEVIELTTMSYNNMTNGGSLFKGKGPFGFNIKQGTGKPGIKIKTSSDGGATFKTTSFLTPEFGGYHRGEIGYLYVRPFQNKIAINPFNIPFQMNAKINENEVQANYASEQFLNRVGEIMTFTGTSSLKLSLETSYTVLSDGSNNKGNNVAYSEWMHKWTPEYVKSIENAYRSLVFSTYYEGIDNPSGTAGGLGGFLKPPIIRILMTTNSSALGEGKIASYPNAKWTLQKDTFKTVDKVTTGEEANWDKDSLDNDYASTLYRLKNDTTIESKYTWRKAFVATGVSITTEDDVGINGSLNQYYTGFKVNLTMTEVTENYLDCIPDFASYYAAFVGDLKAEAQHVYTESDSATSQWALEDQAEIDRANAVASEIAARAALATPTSYYTPTEGGISSGTAAGKTY